MVENKRFVIELTDAYVEQNCLHFRSENTKNRKMA